MAGRQAGDFGAEQTGALAEWIEAQARFSAKAMLRGISATGLIKKRPGFGQSIRPARGSVLASPVMGSYDPDPDYFFHWFRDAALVMDALRVLIEDGAVGADGLGHLADFARFSHGLRGLRGDVYLAGTSPLLRAEPDFRQFVRADTELAAVAGRNVSAETRVNPDGSLDTIRWARPQTDGSALRALLLLRLFDQHAFEAEVRGLMEELIVEDLAFTLRSWREPAFDIWEEESGHHYYTRLVQAAALERGAAWVGARDGHDELASDCADAAGEIERELDAYWSQDLGYYVSRLGVSGGAAHKRLDFATILAVNHAARDGQRHSVLDPRSQATLVRLEDVFAAEFPINQSGNGRSAPAMGRYSGDLYYGGGAWYLATAGAAEFYFCLAHSLLVSPPERLPDVTMELITRNSSGQDLNGPREVAGALVQRGDDFLATIRAYTSPSRELSEQFDRVTGTQTSAKNLTWSYASFITAAAARRRALAKLPS